MEVWQLAIINQLCQESYENAKAHGFWAEGEARNKAEMLALMHSELSEALEELRHGHKPDEVYFLSTGKPEGVPIELADLLIRVFDFCAGFNVNLGQAILVKMEYNKKREQMHGRQF